MSFILSWSGYFSRKGWDPKAWADANSIESYEQCVKRISKMCVKPPTEDQYRTLFIDKPVYSDVEERQAQEVPAVTTKTPYVKVLKPEQAPDIKEAPLTKPTAKPATKPKRRTKKTATPRSEAGSGTSSIIDSVKKKSTTRKSRSRKNAKSS